MCFFFYVCVLFSVEHTAEFYSSLPLPTFHQLLNRDVLVFVVGVCLCNFILDPQTFSVSTEQSHTQLLFLSFCKACWVISPLPPLQAQLIHDRNTASHAAINDKAESVPERVHMTWTKDKLFTERIRNREANASVAVRDLFNMKPWV